MDTGEDGAAAPTSGWWWVLAIAALAGSWTLAWAAQPGTLATGLWPACVSGMFLGLGWRMFERLLHAMYPTRVEHTRAGRTTAVGLCGAVIVQGLLFALGR
jgi:hypothetical protein